MRLTCLPLWFFALSGFSQNCQLLVDEKDEFTGTHKTEVWGQLQWAWEGGATVTFRQIDSLYYLKLAMGQGGTQAMVVGKGDFLMLKLENDSILKLPSSEIASGKFNTTNGVSTTLLECNYELTADALTQLSMHTVTKFRVYLTDSYIERDCKAKHATDARMAAQCLRTKPWRP